MEFINKEVHHRVKNNLQVISSLLDLQSKYAQDNGYQNLLMESKHRVQSMAFIHQNLYASAGLNMVDMPNYVLNLVDHLVTAYQKEGKSKYSGGSGSHSIAYGYGSIDWYDHQ